MEVVLGRMHKAELNIASALPFPVPLVKNSSSADRRGREPSMGMQYLQYPASDVHVYD